MPRPEIRPLADEHLDKPVVDRRVANVESSRVWPARGFRGAFPRLYRSIP